MAESSSTTGRPPPAPSRAVRAAGWLALLAIGSAALSAAWLLLFSTFMDWDDEGLVLLSLRNFSAEGGLYDRLYAQYGPFYFLVTDALSRLLRFEWSSCTGRILALTCWLGSALTCALLVLRRGRSFAAGAFTLAVTFVCLLVDIREPGHPGAFIALLVSVAAYVGAERDPAIDAPAAAAVGALAAALTFTKVNVGGFLVISVGVWYALQSARGRSRVASLALVALLAGLPWALMREQLSDPAAFRYALHTSLGAACAVLAARTTARPVATARAFAGLCLGAGALALVTAVAVSFRGTSLEGLLHGVLLGPLRHPLLNFSAFPWWSGSTVAAAAAAVLTVWGGQGSPPSAALYAIAAVRGIAALLVGYLALADPGAVAFFLQSYGAGLAGVCALPMRRDVEGAADARVRQWLALIWVLQLLHAYPTAGSQIGWGSFLGVPLLALSVRDAYLHAASDRAALRGGVLSRAAASLVVGLSLVAAVQLAGAALVQYRRGASLDLPGAERLALPAATVSSLRALSHNARLHAGVLFSAPGMFSFNLWSGRPTPTLENSNLWQAVLDPAQQQAIVRRLRDDPRAVVIGRPGFPGKGGLYEYILRYFEPAFAVDGYVFLVHQGRRIAPVSTARIGQKSDGRIELTLTLSTIPDPISQIDVHQVDSAGERVVFRLSSGNATLDSAPIAIDGQVTGDPRPLAWPVRLLDPLSETRVEFAGRVPTSGTLLVELQAGARRVATVSVLRRQPAWPSPRYPY